MQTVLAYAATFALVLFGLTQLPNLLTAILFGRLTGPAFAQFAGALISWTIISSLWQRIMGDGIPVLALVGAVGLILYHLKSQFTKLTPPAKSGMFTEIGAIAVVGIWRLAEAKTIHWF